MSKHTQSTTSQNISQDNSPQITLPLFDIIKRGHSSSDSESWAVAGCGGEAGVLAGNGGLVVGSGLA